MTKNIRTTDDYLIYRVLDDEKKVYAIHKNEVAKMNRMKETYANNLVPDDLKVNAYLVKHLSVVNNVVVDYDLESDQPIKVQINLLDKYVLEA